MTGKTDKKPFAAPSFLVPAVIDAVRSSSKYGSLVRMVPGEADGFCARHAASSGATVLTSDSDLLVHDLGTGSVALLRDIYRGEDAVIRCSLYTPSEIFPKLGLPSTSDVHRFAYERWRTTHGTVSSLVRACEDPVTDAGEYKEFRAQYLSEDDEDGALPSLGEHLSIQHLDPRFSEVLLQLCQPESSTSGDSGAKMFLPILIENPDRGTAWEQSTPIRRLAYSVARRMLPGHTTTIQEYRRVQTLDQKGRQVSVLSTKDMLASVEELVQVMSHLKKTTKAKSIPFWPMLYIVLDARECFAQGKDSHVLSTVLQRPRSLWPRENFQRVHWDFMHFVAQLQAAYYSLRMLWQVLHLSTSSAEAILGSHYPTLLEILNGLSGLPESPGVESITQFLHTAQPKVLRETLGGFVDVGEEEPQNTERRSKRHKKDGQSSKKVAQTGASKQNMFDMLAME
ncbi:hypothetical protein K4F52_006648 [Lecanicillium sp. MT-2017a]|nr:hypothetical protein K4F52_006648 [Lecanicillium sp. MT-2017a]